MADEKSREPLLRVEHLTKEFPVESGVFARRAGAKRVHAVEDISFEIYPGETFGLVGESGCGKSTTGRTIMRLNNPTSGRVIFDGKDVAKMKKRELKEMRRNMQYIFQDPYASLNPRMTIGEIVSEPLVIHNVMSNAKERMDYVRSLLDIVGLNPEHINRYPHEFSGGQRQRLAVARALILRPKILVLDEPTSALDVTIQKQVLSLLQRLQRELGLSYLLITHDMDVIRAMAHEVVVMKSGEVVEQGTVDAVLGQPQHPYTQQLVSAML